ncbi:tyrosine-type recombinase/integrase [Janthinobacterium lividum]
MESKVRRIVLPEFYLTETCAADSPGATKIDLMDGSHYFIRSKLLPSEKLRRDGKQSWTQREFVVYPLVMRADGTPWDEANAWILKSLEDQYDFNMSTYRGKADDLQHFRNFLDSHRVDWLDFPDLKQKRPTYRYKGFLRVELETGAMEWSTAKRRMSTAVNFYRWLLLNKFLTPDNPPWEEKVISIPVANSYGRNTFIKTTTTDVNIKNAPADNPYDDRIADGGKLRPLPAQEQAWLLAALGHLGNTEQTLIQVLALSTGARIQTILTIRKSHVLRDYGKGDARLLCGPGTGIDTKGDRRFTIQIPRWLMSFLHTYALSERAANRRSKAPGGDIDIQYLFLSERSAPMYEAKQSQDLSGGKKVRHIKNGQAVRTYMKDYIIPYIKSRHDSEFKYRFHDLRATFGMNLVDELTPRMNAGEFTYMQVLNTVMSRLAHKSPTTTERYLTYRADRKLFEGAQDQWEEKLNAMVAEQMRNA